MKKTFSIFFLLLPFLIIVFSFRSFSQGFTNIWQLGYDNTTFPVSVVDFGSGQLIIDSIERPMNFASEEAIICDSAGELLFYTNGIYIANKNHDTMQNGSGLNPGPFTSDHSEFGLPIFQGALILPWPDSANKYILFHHTLDYSTALNPTILHSSTINMSLDGGLGGVVNKNDTVLETVMEIGELTGCKHANGRDWWVLVHKHSADRYYKILITPLGITRIDSQSVGGPISNYGGSAAFSPDGKWFATFDNLSKLRLYDFDRCTGLLSNLRYINFIPDSIVAGGLCFSPNSTRLYASQHTDVYQFDLTAANIASSRKHIATWDGYYSPYPPYACDFWWMMSGPDGKIYLNSGSSVVDLHVINYPDNLDTLCDLQQHSIHLPGFNNSTLPNHINYWLGADVGSSCDTILTNNESEIENFNLQIFPNPVSNQALNIFYRLPQSTDGTLQIIDVNGRMVYNYHLPMWSTQQSLKLPTLNSGIYTILIFADGKKIAKKLIIE